MAETGCHLGAGCGSSKKTSGGPRSVAPASGGYSIDSGSVTTRSPGGADAPARRSRPLKTVTVSDTLGIGADSEVSASKDTLGVGRTVAHPHAATTKIESNNRRQTFTP